MLGMTSDWIYWVVFLGMPVLSVVILLIHEERKHRRWYRNLMGAEEREATSFFHAWLHELETELKERMEREEREWRELWEDEYAGTSFDDEAQP